MVIEHGTGDKSYRRWKLRDKLLEDLVNVVMRPGIKSNPPWNASWGGFWTISERTIHDIDGFVELFAFGSLRVEVKSGGYQNPVQ